MSKDDDNVGLHYEDKTLRLYRHLKSGSIYRITGSCVNKDTDEFSVLYRKWNDFGAASLSLYVREYKSFHLSFEEYKFKELAISRTLEQLETEFKLKSKKRKR